MDQGINVVIVKAELINFEKQGRLKLLNLTKRGEEVANYVEKVRNVL